MGLNWHRNSIGSAIRRPKGMKQSAGLMVNYLYVLRKPLNRKSEQYSNQRHHCVFHQAFGDLKAAEPQAASKESLKNEP